MAAELSKIMPEPGQIWRQKVYWNHILVVDDNAGVDGFVLVQYTDPSVRARLSQAYPEWEAGTPVAAHTIVIRQQFDYVRSLRG